MTDIVWTIEGRNITEHPDHHAAEYRKVSTVLAAPAHMAGEVETPEGRMAFKEGDYLVTDNPPTHLWPVRRDVFERTHAGVTLPAEPVAPRAVIDEYEAAAEAFGDARGRLERDGARRRFDAAKKAMDNALASQPLPAPVPEAAPGLLADALDEIAAVCDLSLDDMREQHGSEQRVLMAVIPSLVVKARAALAATPPAHDHDPDLCNGCRIVHLEAMGHAVELAATPPAKPGAPSAWSAAKGGWHPVPEAEPEEPPKAGSVEAEKAAYNPEVPQDRTTTATLYPNIETSVDRKILDWYAAAATAYERTGHANDNGWWEGGEGALAFGDIGIVTPDSGPEHHAQIVLHFLPHDQPHKARAISLEVNREDIHLLVRHLEDWLADTRDDPDIQLTKEPHEDPAGDHAR